MTCTIQNVPNQSLKAPFHLVCCFRRQLQAVQTARHSSLGFGAELKRARMWNNKAVKEAESIFGLLIRRPRGEKGALQHCGYAKSHELFLKKATLT